MKRTSILGMAASMVLGLGALASVGHATAANPAPRRRLQENDFRQAREIAAWNNSVDQDKRRKKQDKLTRAIQRRRG